MRPSETYRQRCLQIEEQFFTGHAFAFKARDESDFCQDALSPFVKYPMSCGSGEHIEIDLRSRWCEVARRWWGMQRFLEASHASHASMQVCPIPPLQPEHTAWRGVAWRKRVV